MPPAMTSTTDRDAALKSVFRPRHKSVNVETFAKYRWLIFFDDAAIDALAISIADQLFDFARLHAIPHASCFSRRG